MITYTWTIPTLERLQLSSTSTS